MHAFSEPPISRTAAGAYADSKKTAHAQAAQIVQVSPLPSIAARSPWPLVFVAPIFSDISSS